MISEALNSEWNTYSWYLDYKVKSTIRQSRHNLFLNFTTTNATGEKEIDNFEWFRRYKYCGTNLNSSFKFYKSCRSPGYVKSDQALNYGNQSLNRLNHCICAN